MSDCQRERLIRQQMGHQRALDCRDPAQPGTQGRGVKQVAGVEQRRQKNDRRPRHPGADEADRRELRGSCEDDDAHRRGLQRRVARSSRGQAEYDPEAASGRGDSQRIEQELPARGGRLLA